MMKKRRWIMLSALALVALVLFNLPEATSTRVKGAVRDGISPLQAAWHRGLRGLRETFRYIRGLGDLALENRALSEEIVYLRGQVRMAQELARDNQLLREQLGFQQRFPATLISCEVIGRDSAGWWQTVRLDKGALAGVAAERAVITTDGLIGRTVAVSDRTADVLLLADPSCKVAVRVARGGVFGICTGLGNKPGEQPVCRMDYIPQTASVEEGDEVLTSGLGGVFPKGLLVGHIVRVEPSESGLYRTAWIKSAADLGKLEYGFVAATETDLANARRAAETQPALDDRVAEDEWP
ncbi:MAG TPA: rod shape-determining protein MreC [Kiritimatiellia bacterium]|jgi:rod shape-determining protein MreC|nr:rod shape-determining protein MreC [Kiritimatiellia bacterium]HQF19631.1 rod shape-determining protein MreC [Kiritimatiellia bacterium]HQM22779.1 rod shape-determining protein MreC [Kiritimatiellia bacterium]